jgi:kojibiose phosphorylase
MLGIPPGQCLVVEDSAAGIEAALTAGMPALALGPPERFDRPSLRRSKFSRRDSLMGVTLDELRADAQLDQTWTVDQRLWEPDKLRHMETVFTIGNGYFASRGSFEEGFPGDLSFSLAHGIYDDLPIVFTELVNLPNWLDFSLEVDGHTFRMDQGDVLHFRRYLDLHLGILHREVRWRAPNKTVVDLTLDRFISYPEEHIGALRILITAVDKACQINLAAGINGNVANEQILHWDHLAQGMDETGSIWLHSQTKHSHVEIGVATSIQSSGDEPASCQQCPGHPRFTLIQELEAGESLQIEKIVSYATSRDRDRDGKPVAQRALDLVRDRGFDDLQPAHMESWDQLWEDCDVIIEGDDEAQLAVRFSLFQLLIAAPQHDNRVSIGAKTLSGPGYRGHVFWDTEIFALPFFIFTQPELARNMLIYRYNTLPGARRKAAANGYAGAQFAWESAGTGDEVTPTWVPDHSGKGLVRIWTGDIEIHITADIAYAVDQYWQMTGDDAFMRDYGVELILDTARFWGHRAELEEDSAGRRYAIRDVIGPDEYHDHIDNNAYTNRLVQRHLEKALHLHRWMHQHHPTDADALDKLLELGPELLAHWQDIVDHIILNHDPDTGLITQFDDFFDRIPIDWSSYKGRTDSMQYLLGIDGANASQVIKQADVILLLCLLGDEYDVQTWRANWDTYVPITDHAYGSSLGPSTHAWAAAEMNLVDEAYDYFILAAKADIQNIRGNVADGIHAASAGGLWQAVVFGFAGLRVRNGAYTLSPRLPGHWRRLSFSFYLHGKRIEVDLRPGSY